MLTSRFFQHSECLLQNPWLFSALITLNFNSRTSLPLASHPYIILSFQQVIASFYTMTKLFSSQAMQIGLAWPGTWWPHERSLYNAAVSLGHQSGVRSRMLIPGWLCRRCKQHGSTQGTHVLFPVHIFLFHWDTVG